MLKRLSVLLLIGILTVSLILSGCNKTVDEGPKLTPDDAGEVADVDNKKSDDDGKATDEGYGILRNASASEAKVLNPHTYTSSSENDMMEYCNATLYRSYITQNGANSEVVAELADGEPIQMDDDGMIWHIKIDKDAKWANGEAINADTFMYSFKMILDPKLLNRRAARFAESAVIIENAKDYYMQLTDDEIGEVDWEDVGIKKIDEHTIEIRSTIKVSAVDIKSRFGGASAAPVYEKLYEEHMNEDRTETSYGTDIDKFMSSGPFMLDKWIKDNERHYLKNPNFVNKDLIYLAGIHTRIIPDKGAQMQLFDNGELDYISLSAADFVKYEEDPRVLYAPKTSVSYIGLNTDNPDVPLGNKNFRKALFYAVDRETVSKLVRHKPANYIISSRKVMGREGGPRWRNMDEAKEILEPNYGYNPELALEYFNKALEEEGLDKVSLQLNYADNSDEMKEASEFLQSSLPKVFGEDKFELKLQSLPSNQRSAAMKEHKTDPRSYELSWAGWSGQEFNPWNTVEPFTSNFASKNEPFYNDRIDELYHEVNNGPAKYDMDAKVKITQECEQIMLEELPIIPVYEGIDKFLKSDRVQLPVKEWMNGVEFAWLFSQIVD